MVNNYELTVIERADIADKDRKKIVEMIKKLLVGDSKLVREEEIGKKKLAYPIKKESDGFYRMFTLQCPGSVVSSIRDKLRLDQAVLRFLFVRADSLKVKKAKNEKKS